MKRHTYDKLLTVIIVIFCLLTLSSCHENITQQELFGSLSIITSYAGQRTIEPEASEIVCDSYNAYGVFSDGVHTFEKAFNGSSVTIDQLLVGTWTIHVEGYNSDGILVASSSSSDVAILPAQTTSETFNLEYLTEGNGTLSLSVKIPVSDTTTATISVTVGDDSFLIEKPENSTDGYYVFDTSRSYSTGSYSVVLLMQDSAGNPTGLPFIDSAIIYPNLTSAKIWTSPERTMTPVITPSDGIVDSETEISITCGTEGSVIYYTTDGSTPSTESTKYTGTFTIDRNTVIKAIAVSNGLFNSFVGESDLYVKAAMPTASTSAGLFEAVVSTTLSTATPNGVIHYTTDGSAPTDSSAVYSAELSFSRSTTLKAITTCSGFMDSDVLILDYTVKAGKPQTSVIAGSYDDAQTIVLSSATDGATIFYTLDGTTPTSSSTPYTQAIQIEESTTIKAIAIASGCDNSDILEANYVILSSVYTLPAPTFSLASGTYSTTQTVTISHVDQATGVNIYYTIDGSTPTRESTLYTEPIQITQNTVLKAYAVWTGAVDSSVTTAEYHIKVAEPSFLISGGSFSSQQTIEISCPTDSTSIYYTTDGSQPTTSSTLYVEPLVVGQSTTIKAIAVKVGFANSDVVTEEYIINGISGIRVIDPVHYSLSIDTPSDWITGQPIITRVRDVLYANLSPASDSAVYSWLIDGVEARYNNGDSVGNNNHLSLGTYGTNVGLSAGYHVITLNCQIGSVKLSESSYIYLSDTATIGTSGYFFLVGERGPAGGYIFYDCDADNSTGNGDNLISSECGWRFLEAAPATLRVVNGVLTVDSSYPGYTAADGSSTRGCVFGYYRINDENTVVGTDVGIGSGKNNTRSLVTAMGNLTYSYYTGDNQTAYYAAKVCDDLEVSNNGDIFNDWFLPSIGELQVIKDTLLPLGVVENESDYWSSTESGAEYARKLYLGAYDSYNGPERACQYRVLPVRSF